MHRERLHLSLKNLHSGSGNNGTYIWNHCVRKHLIDQLVIPNISWMSLVFFTESIIQIYSKDMFVIIFTLKLSYLICCISYE